MRSKETKVLSGNIIISKFGLTLIKNRLGMGVTGGTPFGFDLGAESGTPGGTLQGLDLVCLMFRLVKA